MIGIAAAVCASEFDPENAMDHPNLDIELGICSRLGYDGVELIAEGSLKIDERTLRHMLDDRHLEVIGLCMNLANQESTYAPGEMETKNGSDLLTRIGSFVELAAHFGSRTMVTVVLPDRLDSFGEPRTWAALQDVIQAGADLARLRGVDVAIEASYSDRSKTIVKTRDLVGFVKRVNRPNLGLALDPYAASIEGIDADEYIRHVGQLCKIVHLNEIYWRHRDPVPGLWGIVRVLRRVQFAGYISLRLHPCPDMKTVARQALKCLRDSNLDGQGPLWGPLTPFYFS